MKKIGFVLLFLLGISAIEWNCCSCGDPQSSFKLVRTSNAILVNGQDYTGEVVPFDRPLISCIGFFEQLAQACASTSALYACDCAPPFFDMDVDSVKIEVVEGMKFDSLAISSSFNPFNIAVGKYVLFDMDNFEFNSDQIFSFNIPSYTADSGMQMRDTLQFRFGVKNIDGIEFSTETIPIIITP